MNSISTADSVSKDKFEIFQKWLLDNGAKFENLELRDYGDEVRGCHSTKMLGRDTVIIGIPLKCLITVEMGMDTWIGRKVIEQGVAFDAPKHIFLMLFMLIDMLEANSFFKPYYDILPETLYNMPIFWNDRELSYLQGSYLVTQIEERKLAIEKDYDVLCDLIPEFVNMCSLTKFKWARMAVCSRNFGISLNGIKTAVMVPYADMLNHLRPRETKWQFDDNTQQFSVVSLQNIPCGAQVFDSYGEKSNHRFLLNYGFSVENNIESDGHCPNEVPILLQLQKSDSNYDIKFRNWWIKESTTSFKRVRLSMCENNAFLTLMSCLRVIVANQQEFEAIVPGCFPDSTTSYNKIRNMSGGVFYHRNPLREAAYPISTTNEIKVLYLFKSICEDYLSKYKFKYCEHQQMLLQKDANDEYVYKPYSNLRNAIIQVIGEQEVLQFYIHLCVVGLKLLHIKSWKCHTVLTDGVINRRDEVADFELKEEKSASSPDSAAVNTKNIFEPLISKNELHVEAQKEVTISMKCGSVENVSATNADVLNVKEECKLIDAMDAKLELQDMKEKESELDIFTLLDREIESIRQNEANPMVYNYCKNQVYQIRLQDDRKCTLMKRSIDYTKPTTV